MNISKLQGKKVLTVCAAGISRSYSLMAYLKFRGVKDTLCAGVLTNTPDTMKMLGDWADVIILTVAVLKNQEYPKEWEKKTLVWDVGDDRYFRGIHPDLETQFAKYLADYEKE